MKIQFILFGLTLIIASISGYLHIKSINYEDLEKRLGSERAKSFVKNIGSIAVDLEMLSLFLIWFIPQPRFYLNILEFSYFNVPFIGYRISLFHSLISIPFVAIGLWLIIDALIVMGKELSIEHKKPERVIKERSFSIIRHPQNLGGALLHIGMTILVSGWFSLIVIPLFLLFDYYIAKKEELELIKYYGNQYTDYIKEVPMFIPKLFGEFGSSKLK